ncbi:SIS-containing protein [Coleophoma cylindrospora]|uniref:SIS-containing protein n=1 Tax=Coleophoma cylindrospora TaxID=1849047 RepID=A0A3D8Q8A3_9HELO|nr:SIS-containing protein [Coleophoma cylindrospora]
MFADHPVQNSEVYLCNSSHSQAIPPPSPPSPATPCEPVDDILAITPPELQDGCPTLNSRLANAVHVLNTEATALSALTRLYETDPIARGGFDAAVNAITRFKGDKGKLVISGVGKSGHIAKKLVATMNSLAIHATYLHPTEALHGDLGKVGKHDTILLITFSGKTPELLQLLPHFAESLPVVIMTSHIRPSTCEIIKQRPATILLPAPIHESETLSFGVSAPTTSTTMALALGDALAVAISNEYHPQSVAAVFSMNHPGGAIGATFAGPKTVGDLSLPLIKIWEVTDGDTGAHVILAAYQSKTGWVRRGNSIVASPLRIKRMSPSDMNQRTEDIEGLMVPSSEWIQIPADTDITVAREKIISMRNSVVGADVKYGNDSILATIKDGEITGVMEVAALFTKES